MAINTSKQQTMQFLRFCLEPDTNVMLPVTQITEVLNVPERQIVPIPQMPPWVSGVYNWRGEILWMIDLGHLVGLTPRHQQTKQTSTNKAIVLNCNATNPNQGGEVIGLIVSRVEDMEWCNPDDIQSLPAEYVTTELAPFLRGYWLNPNNQIVVTIDGESIFAAMPKP